MGVRDAIAGGLVEQEFLDAACAAARVVTASLKPPSGHGRWSPDEIGDLVHDLIAGASPGSFVLAATRADSDDEFKGWLRTALRNELHGRARRTPLGKVVVAVDAALREAPQKFRLALLRWGLIGVDAPASWEGGEAELIAVARTVQTADPPAHRTAATAPRLARREDIRSVSEAVLAVSGPLPKAPLARVHAARFNARFEEVLSSFDEGSSARTASAASDSDFSVSNTRAREMLGELSDDDRTVLLCCLAPSGGLRGIGEALGCKKSKAQAIKERLLAKLRRLAAESDDPEQAVELLLNLIRQTTDLEHSLDQDGTDAH